MKAVGPNGDRNTSGQIISRDGQARACQTAPSEKEREHLGDPLSLTFYAETIPNHHRQQPSKEKGYCRVLN